MLVERPEDACEQQEAQPISPATVGPSRASRHRGGCGGPAATPYSSPSPRDHRSRGGRWPGRAGRPGGRPPPPRPRPVRDRALSIGVADRGTTSATIASARTVPRARPPARTVPTRPGWASPRRDGRSRYEIPRRPPRPGRARGRERRTSPPRSGSWSAGPAAVARAAAAPRGTGLGIRAPPRRRRAAFAALAQPSSPGSRYAVHERQAHRQARSPTAGGRQRHGGDAGRRGGCSTQCRSLVPVRGDTGCPPHGNRARSCMVAASAPLTRLP